MDEARQDVGFTIGGMSLMGSTRNARILYAIELTKTR